MKCPRCFNDKTVKNGKKYGLSVSQRYFCHNCRHLFYIRLDQKAVKPLRKFSLKKEIFRQIIRADIEEDKHRVVKEYSF